MAIRQRLTYDSWFSKYQPVQNPFHDYGCNGTLFETTEKELAVVRTADPQRVWTLIDCDGEWFIKAGKYFANRIGYFVSSRPAAPEDMDRYIAF
ncbi:hypothetical protein [Pseudacidobacterium ailaaui]|jgi:hypothetical protein|uniref:hypothetical protein n=1 Tax=Pseudacidobacterium ailaaui TaxID=1382359 RepID=UPI00047A3AE1|nr:hypothetical protein [Pseudacidobacterium ailaaui]